VNHVSLDEKDGFVFPGWIHKKQEMAKLLGKISTFVGYTTGQRISPKAFSACQNFRARREDALGDNSPTERGVKDKRSADTLSEIRKHRHTPDETVQSVKPLASG
jgi:hypothetical protein